MQEQNESLVEWDIIFIIPYTLRSDEEGRKKNRASLDKNDEVTLAILLDEK